MTISTLAGEADAVHGDLRTGTTTSKSEIAPIHLPMEKSLAAVGAVQ